MERKDMFKILFLYERCLMIDCISTIGLNEVCFRNSLICAFCPSSQLIGISSYRFWTFAPIERKIRKCGYSFSDGSRARGWIKNAGLFELSKNFFEDAEIKSIFDIDISLSSRRKLLNNCIRKYVNMGTHSWILVEHLS